MTILRYFASFLFLQLMIICQTFTSLEAHKAPIPDGPQWHSLNTDNENNKHNFNTHRYNWLARDHIKTRSLNLCNIILSKSNINLLIPKNILVYF